MDVWWNNHFLYQDLESSNWNSHLQTDVSGFRGNFWILQFLFLGMFFLRYDSYFLLDMFNRLRIIFVAIRFISKLGGGNKCWLFHPYLAKWSNLTNIFQMGWNHQQEKSDPESGSTIRTLLHGIINPKDWQVLSIGDVGFLLFFMVVSGDYGKPWEWSWKHVFFILGPSLKATTIRNKDGIRSHQITHLYPNPCYHILPCVYLESKWPLYLKINPPKQGLFQSKRGRGSFPNHCFFKGHVNEFQGVRIKLHPCSFLFTTFAFFMSSSVWIFRGGMLGIWVTQNDRNGLRLGGVKPYDSEAEVTTGGPNCSLFCWWVDGDEKRENGSLIS